LFACAVAPALAPATAAAAQPTTGERTVAVVLVRYSDSVGSPVDNQTLHDWAFTDTGGLADYIDDASEGRLALTGDAFGPFTLAKPRNQLSEAADGTSAKNMAAALRIDLARYDNVMYLLDSGSSNGGLADLNGSRSWVRCACDQAGFTATRSTLDVSARRVFGRNLGLPSASAWACSSAGAPVVWSVACTNDADGDPYDAMGSGTGGYNNVYRKRLSWLAGGAETTIGADTTVEMHPRGSAGGLTQLVRIPRATNASGAVVQYLDLEVRAPSGYDTPFGGDDQSGILVRVTTPAASATAPSLLIDMHPNTVDASDFGLLQGESWTDSVSGATISVTSLVDGDASVDIDVADNPASLVDSTAPPAPQISFSRAGAMGYLQATTPPDLVGINHFAVWRWNLGSWVLISNNIPTPLPGPQGVHSVLLDATTTYAVRVQAFDHAGNASPVSEFEYTDRVGPPPPPVVTISHPLDSGYVGLSWTGTDPGATASYRIYRDDHDGDGWQLDAEWPATIDHAELAWQLHTVTDVRVSAVLRDGSEVDSDSLVLEDDTTPPPAPNPFLQQRAGTEFFTVWSDVPDDDIATLRLESEIRTGASGWSRQEHGIAQRPAELRLLTRIATERRFVRVRAVDWAGNASAWVTLVLEGASAPVAPPAPVTWSRSAGTARILVPAHPDANIDTMTLWRRSGDDWTMVHTWGPGPQATHSIDIPMGAADVDLAVTGTYPDSVETPQSTTLTVRGDREAPNLPAAPAARARTTAIDVTWRRATDDVAVGSYRVTVRRVGGGRTHTRRLAGSAHRVRLRHLHRNRRYRVCLRALDLEGKTSTTRCTRARTRR
jgi:hypothetical protein